jgi:hypothetical protein
VTKRYEFKFSDFDCNNADDDYLPYPVSSVVDAAFDFEGTVTWDVILWQFCKFLEATGYEGVRSKIRLVDNLGFMENNFLFECITEGDDTYDWVFDDTEEDEKENTNEEKVTVSYKDMKNEVA